MPCFFFSFTHIQPMTQTSDEGIAIYIGRNAPHYCTKRENFYVIGQNIVKLLIWVVQRTCAPKT